MQELEGISLFHIEIMDMSGMLQHGFVRGNFKMASVFLFSAVDVFDPTQQRIGIERNAIDMLRDEELRKLRMIAGGLAAKANLPVRFARTANDRANH